jgi:NAD(P)-dependent dehydrogenase (short-subunit alcohol dehydrogenase family)
VSNLDGRAHPPPPDFEGRVAIVTGAASGIGRAAAAQLAARGAAVVAADVDSVGLDSLVDEITRERGTAIAFPVDVADLHQVGQLVPAAMDTYGRLDVAVNNAGVSGTYAPLADQTIEDWDRTLAINLTSVFVCLQAQIPAMLETGGGAIVNTASAAGQMGFAHLPAYVASKHGIIGLTKSVALEFARQGIRVNAICPGTVRTGMLREFAGSEQALEQMGAMAPIGRIGEPDEVAAAAVWLCSDAAAFVTGHALAVDGGVLAT